MSDYKLLINGELVDGNSMDVVNPATEDVVGTCTRGTEDMLEQAVAAAKAAFSSWAATSIDERRDMLNKFADIVEENTSDLAALLTAEQGKPLAEAEGEIQGAVAFTRHFATLSLAHKLIREDETCRIEEHYLPLGVIGAIIPWNFPILVMCFKLPPAMLAGNTIVLKPSPTTPLTTLRILELTKDIFPAGVINVITDENDLGAKLTAHENIAKISFTGSTDTGKKVMGSSSETLKRITLELGGNDPAIVLPDADLDSTAANIFGAAFVNCGQVCIAVKRVYVHESIYEPLCEKLVELAQNAVVDDGSNQGATMGPLQNKQQYEKVKEILETAKQDGVVAAGGAVMERAGYFVEPTIIRDVEDGTRIVDEEQFGPILPLVKFDNLDSVVNRVNEGEYGLGASVWSSDISSAHSVAQKIHAGTVWINQHFALAPDVPFGGAKNSGIGVESADAGLAEYTQRQIINVGK